ncbi:hypothetical protein [Rhodococcoides fascians]|uniref:hypothetical protein n=1 Tax=Rhodococcoides fascians TaxID=1828 RepID=UPI0005679427|nr:hypothetical protein [Rhodococcus fascians]
MTPDEISQYLDIHHPHTPRYQLPRHQGPIWATVSAALGFKTMLILHDFRESRELFSAVDAVADMFRGAVRHTVSTVRAEFPGGGELLIRGQQGRNITRRFDQIVTLADGPAERPA